MAKTVNAKNRQAQSAIEYLITHSWAFLIIAVVLVILYQLGVFTSSTYTPKITPGACYVSRAINAYTTQFSLTGECAGLPEYITNFTSSSGGYVGFYSPTNSLLNFPSSTGRFTVSFWLDVAQVQTSAYPILFALGNSVSATAPLSIYLVDPGSAAGSYSTYNVPNLEYYDTKSMFHSNLGGGSYSNTGPVSAGKFIYLVLVFAKSSATWYVNGQQFAQFGGLSNPVSTTPSSSNVFVGSSGLSSAPAYFNGNIANIQIYNTSLSSAAIYQQYLAGIGAPPVDLQNLVAWWPLNGDTNDYSGLGDNGYANSILYTTNWAFSYTTP